MEELIKILHDLRSKEDVYQIIKSRLKEFEAIDRNNDVELFSELAFCILTANFNAERAIKIQKEVKEGFLLWSEEKLAYTLRRLGYRYPNTRAKYIVNARNILPPLKELLQSNIDEFELRQWLSKNVKGLGLKESSHFLRNIGFKHVAIVDFHIIDLLVKYNIIQRPKTLTKKRYLEVEEVLDNIAKKIDVTLAELDLLLWYLETGKSLK